MSDADRVLDDLIAKLEAAREGNAALDDAIMDVVADSALKMTYHGKYGWQFTRSLDAALRLYDDDGLRQFKLERNSAEFGDGWHVSYRSMFFGHSTIAPIACCIAALRARRA